MKLIFPVFLLIIFYGCSNSKSVNEKNEQPNFGYNIILGTGGGVTGNYEGNFIDSTGAVYKWQGRIFQSSQKEFIKNLDQKELEKIDSLINSANFFEEKFSSPGNLTSYIKIRSGEKENTITWSGTEFPAEINDKIKDLHQQIISITKNK